VVIAQTEQNGTLAMRLYYRGDPSHQIVRFRDKDGNVIGEVWLAKHQSRGATVAFRFKPEYHILREKQ
jgi:hypothetical protein